MKTSLIFAFIFSLLIFSINAVSLKIIKVENCSSSNKSIQINKCEGFENQISIFLNVHRPLNKLNVSFAIFYSVFFRI